jgi:hypothetical protein
MYSIHISLIEEISKAMLEHTLHGACRYSTKAEMDSNKSKQASERFSRPNNQNMLVSDLKSLCRLIVLVHIGRRSRTYLCAPAENRNTIVGQRARSWSGPGHAKPTTTTNRERMNKNSKPTSKTKRTMENDDVSQPSFDSNNIVVNEEPHPVPSGADATTDVAVVSDNSQEESGDRKADLQQEQDGSNEPQKIEETPNGALIWKRNIWLEDEGSFCIIEDETAEEEIRADTTTTTTNPNYYGTYQPKTTKGGVRRKVGKIARPLSKAEKTKYNVKRGKAHPTVVVSAVGMPRADSLASAEEGKSLNASLPPTRFNLIPTDSRTIQDEAAKLTPFNRLTVEALDLYQVTADDLPLLAARRKKSLTNVPVGSVGIRCRYCAANDATMTTVGSLLFPGRLSSLSAILYHMRERHLVDTECPHLPLSVHTRFCQLQQASTGTGSRSAGRNGHPVVGLPSYLRGVMAHYHIVDNPQGNGIVRRQNYPDQREEERVEESPPQDEE